MSNATPVKKKKKPGKPDKYRSEYATQAGKLCLLGYKDCHLAEFFGVANVTLHRWKKSHAEFRAAIEGGRDLADGEVVETLYRRALGFKQTETDVKVIGGKVVKTEYTKSYPPDTVACIFWLKNRQSQRWREKPQPENINHVIAATEKIRAETAILNKVENETPVAEILDFIRNSNNADAG